jgi:hypothetical protein
MRVDEEREQFVQLDGDCREIVVVPPVGASFDDPEQLAAIRAGLAERFPQFIWKVESGPIRDDVAFFLIPKLEGVGNGLLREPPLDVVKAVRDYLSENFTPNRRLH